ncbi:MAG: preprotein translocase subunit SecG [Syntrophales bacterium]|nr:preprotein translocase subunit SecG [Syntrophales bacterium]
MQVIVTIVHILVCIILILVVLLQAGRGANMGAVFGGSSQTIFGTSGPGTFLGKVTTVVAIIFMLTSLSLTYFSLQKGSPSLKKASRAPIERPAPTPTVPQAPTK